MMTVHLIFPISFFSQNPALFSPEVTFSADGTNFPLREVRTRPMLNVLSSIITSSKVGVFTTLYVYVVPRL